MTTRTDLKARAIRKQALLGLLILLVGTGIAWVIGQRVGWDAVERNPNAVLPAIVVISAGAVLVAIARIRMLFHRPVQTLARSGARHAARSILEALGN